MSAVSGRPSLSYVDDAFLLAGLLVLELATDERHEWWRASVNLNRDADVLIDHLSAAVPDIDIFCYSTSGLNPGVLDMTFRFIEED